MKKIGLWGGATVALIVLVLGWAAISWITNRKTIAPVSQESPSAVSADMASYTNSKGEKWSIETGSYDFTASSAENYPKFVSGNIDPLKVSIGETQHMSVVIRDNVPLIKVWAEIENDNGTDTVPLTLSSSSAVTENEIENQRYLVDASGALVANNASSNENEIQDLVESLVDKAEAEQAMDYSYSGSWVAHNTRNITYHTSFYAEDAQGRTAHITLAWSDPSCAANVQGYLSGPCNPTSPWGVDGGNLNLNGLTITMGSGGAIVYNSGKSITLSAPGSAIMNISAASPIVKGNLWYVDADGDGYAPNNIMSYDTANPTTSTWSGHVRANFANGETGGTSDCDDNASTGANVHPGQTAWFSTPDTNITGYAQNNALGYDYNCSGAEEEQLTEINATYQSSYYPSSVTVAGSLKNVEGACISSVPYNCGTILPGDTYQGYTDNSCVTSMGSSPNFRDQAVYVCH